MTTKELLILGKEKLIKDGWIQNMLWDDRREKCCAMGAVWFFDQGQVYQFAKNQLHQATGGYFGLATFNDAPGRTAEEILELYDKAIAMCGENV